MRRDVVVEIGPDGQAQLRLVILPPEPIPSRGTPPESDRGVVEIPLYPPEEEEGVVVWEM